MFTSHNFRLTILGPRKYTSGSVLQCIWRSEVIMFLFQVQLASEVLFFALRFASEMRISGVFPAVIVNRFSNNQLLFLCEGLSHD